MKKRVFGFATILLLLLTACVKDELNEPVPQQINAPAETTANGHSEEPDRNSLADQELEIQGNGHSEEPDRDS